VDGSDSYDTVIDMSNITDRLDKVDGDLGDLKQSQDQLSSDVREMMASFAQLMEENRKLMGENKVLHQRCGAMESELADIKSELQKLRNDYEGSNQHQRINNIIISGIEYQDNERAEETE